MKKLAAFFVILISLTVLIGCNGSKKTVTSSTNSNGTKTTITTLEQGKTTTSIPPKTTIDNSKSTTKAATTTDNTTSNTNTADRNDVEFAIISLINDKLDTTKSYNVISGLTPKTTAKITINNYLLSKYKAGETKWSYIAATSLGNLTKGTNNYVVNAYDSKGNSIATKKFTINYNGTDNGSLASTGSNSLILSLLASIAVGALYLRRRIA